MVNLADYSYLYNLKQCIFDAEELVNVLSEWIENGAISEVLRSVVVNMCCQEPARRMRSEELISILKKH